MQRPTEVKVFPGSVCWKGLGPPDQNRFQWMKEYLLFRESEAMSDHGKSHTMTGFYPCLPYYYEYPSDYFSTRWLLPENLLWLLKHIAPAHLEMPTSKCWEMSSLGNTP